MDSLNFLFCQHNTGEASLSIFEPVNFLGLFFKFFFKPMDFLKLGFILKLGLLLGTCHLVQGHAWL